MAFISTKCTWAALFAAGAAGAAARAQDEAFLAEHAELTARSDLQFEMTGMTFEPPRPLPDWLVSLFEFIAPLIRIAFWGAVVVAVAFLLYFLARELLLVRLRRPHKGEAADDAIQDYRPAPELAQVLLSEVDRLAAEGRYAEAARHLLHRSIQDIESRRPGGLSRALTAREIAGHPALANAARAPFAAIARTVERAFFAGRELDAADFAACRDAYAQFALPDAAPPAGAAA